VKAACETGASHPRHSSIYVFFTFAVAIFRCQVQMHTLHRIACCCWWWLHCTGARNFQGQCHARIVGPIILRLSHSASAEATPPSFKLLKLPHLLLLLLAVRTRGSRPFIFESCESGKGGAWYTHSTRISFADSFRLH